MVEQGDVAPGFTLSDQDGDEVSLSKLRGKAVVLYFYPKADTPGAVVTEPADPPNSADGVLVPCGSERCL